MEQTPQTDLSTLLREWREAAGISQEMAARLVSELLSDYITADMVARYENPAKARKALEPRIVGGLTGVYGHDLRELPPDMVRKVRSAHKALAIPGLLKSPVAA